MVSPFFAYAVKGFQDRGDELLGQRQKIAQAFAQFKAENPTATLAEFQAFIDQMSDGNNYLRGGAPADDVLRTLAAENKKRQQEQEQERAFNALKRNTETTNLYRGYIDQARKAGIRSPEEALDYFYKTNKVEDPAARDSIRTQFMGLNPSGVIADLDRQEIDALSLTLGQQINNGLIMDPAILNERLPEYLRNTDLAKAALQNLTGVMSQRDQMREREMMGEAQRLAIQAVESGAKPDDMATIVGQFFPQGHPRFEQMLKNFQRKYEMDFSMRTREHQRRLRMEMDRVIYDPLTMSAIAKNPALLRQRLKQAGFSDEEITSAQVDTPETSRLLQSIYNDSLDGQHQKLTAALMEDATQMAEGLSKDNRAMVDAAFPNTKLAGHNAMQSLAAEGYIFGPQELAIAQQIISAADKDLSAVDLRGQILQAAKPKSKVEYIQSSARDRAAAMGAFEPEGFNSYVEGSMQNFSRGWETAVGDIQSAKTPQERDAAIWRAREYLALAAKDAQVRSASDRWVKAGDGDFNLRRLQEYQRLIQSKAAALEQMVAAQPASTPAVEAAGAGAKSRPFGDWAYKPIPDVNQAVRGAVIDPMIDDTGVGQLNRRILESIGLVESE